MFEYLKVVFKSLHYVDYDRSQVHDLMILVVTIDRADLTNKELIAPSAHLSEREAVQVAEFCWGSPGT